MRLNNSLKNITYSLILQIIIVGFGFLTRKVFLDNLGIEFLGINGLLTNVLSMLGLAEMGIGTSIIYNLYKPLAEKNQPKIIALIQLYKKLYRILAVVVFFLSLCLYPFLDIFIKDNNIKNLNLIYFIFVLKNTISYLYVYKFSLLNADQKNYLISRRNLLFQILLSVSKIYILYFYKSYIIFLLIEILILIIQNFNNSKLVESIYPYIKTKQKYSIDLETKKNIVKNVKAMFLHNIGSYCVFGTDNLLISYFINVSTVGLYSNYSMLIFQVNNLSKPIFEGMGASIGNLLATESVEKNYSIFKITYMLNFFINSIFVICLFNLVEPFIIWWLGDNLLLNKLTFIVLLINFYLTGMRASIGMFKSRAGIFHEDRFMPLLESIINLGCSLILVNYFGLAGIFLGTTVSTISIVFWNVPRLVYKNIFNKPLYLYFYNYFIYVVLTLVGCIVTSGVISLIQLDVSLYSLIIKGLISLFLPIVLFTILLHRTSEFRYLFNILKNKISN